MALRRSTYRKLKCKKCQWKLYTVSSEVVGISALATIDSAVFSAIVGLMCVQWWQMCLQCRVVCRCLQQSGPWTCGWETRHMYWTPSLTCPHEVVLSAHAYCTVTQLELAYPKIWGIWPEGIPKGSENHLWGNTVNSYIYCSLTI